MKTQKVVALRWAWSSRRERWVGSSQLLEGDPDFDKHEFPLPELLQQGWSVVNAWAGGVAGDTSVGNLSYVLLEKDV